MINLVAVSKWMARVIILALLLSTVAGCAPSGDPLTEDFAEPLNGATAAKLDIDAGDGNLTVDTLTGGESLLAGGTLQYFESQGLPARTLVAFNGEATLTLQGGKATQSGIRLPWAACNGATEWQIHLNPTVPSYLAAHSNGGNIKLNLAGMTLTRLSTDTGGGNVEVVLPDSAADLSVTAKSGAGNVIVHVPSGVAAKIHATTGAGKVIVGSPFSKIDDHTYQSPDYDSAAQKVEITLDSGAGNVQVITD